MKTYIILNGDKITLINADDSTEAYHRAINFSDHSREIVLREVVGIHNCTEQKIYSQNVTLFNQIKL